MVLNPGALADAADPTFTRTSLFISTLRRKRGCHPSGVRLLAPAPARLLGAGPRGQAPPPWLRRFARLVATRGELRGREALASLAVTAAPGGSLGQRRLASLKGDELGVLAR